MKIIGKDGTVYKYIPGQLQMAISEDGRLMHKGFIYPHSLARGVYISFNHNVKGLTRYRHRLVAMAWKEPPDNYKELDVNHLDAIPGSDHADNLEWATRLENTLHGVSLGNYGNKTIYVKTGSFGEIRSYPSIRQAARDTSLTPSHISFGLMKSEVYRNNTGLYFSRSEELIADESVLSREVILRYGSPILVNNITGAEYTFNNIAEIVKSGKSGMTAAIIANKLSVRGSEVSDEWRIEYLLDDARHILCPADEDTRIKSHSIAGRSIRVYDIIDGVERTFSSINDACTSLGLIQDSVRTILPTPNSPTSKPKYRFSLDPNFVFPTTLTFNDVARVASMRLVGVSGEVLTEGVSGREYADNVSALGYGSSKYIRRKALKHITNMRKVGNDVHYVVGGVTFVTDDLKTVRRLE